MFFSEDGAKTKIYEIYGGSQFDWIIPWLDVSPTGKFKALWGSVKNIYDVFMVVGVMLVVIYFLTSMMDRATREGTSHEMFFKSLSELLIALLLITYGYELMTNFISLGTAFIKDIQTGMKNSTSSSESVADLIWQQTKEEADSIKLPGFFMWAYWAAKYMGTFMIPDLATRIGGLFVLIAALSRAVEIVVYSFFFPVAISDVFKNGMSSHGVRYIKKYIAICIQGAVMVAILVASTYLTGVLSLDDTKGIGNAFYSMGTMFVTVSLIFKSRQIANDIVGV